MPDLMTEIKHAIGSDATDALLTRFGGIHVRVPLRVRPNHAIEHAIGLEAFTQLVHFFGGETLVLPSRYRERLERRNAQIVTARASGQSVESIARAHNLTTRTVFSILSRHRSLAA